MRNRQTNKYPPRLVVVLLRAIGYAISKAFWFVRYEGKENIPDESYGPFMVAANHQTYIDPVWICLPIGRKFRFMAYDKAFEWRVIGPLMRYLGAFPVSLEPGTAVTAMKQALQTFRDGAALTVFPEGAREFADGEILPFKTGAVRIAMQARVPILPVTITGGNRIWPRKHKYPRLFRRVTIKYHPLMEIKRDHSVDQREELEALTARLMAKIAEGP